MAERPKVGKTGELIDSYYKPKRPLVSWCTNAKYQIARYTDNPYLVYQVELLSRVKYEQGIVRAKADSMLYRVREELAKVGK